MSLSEILNPQPAPAPPPTPWEKAVARAQAAGAILHRNVNGAEVKVELSFGGRVVALVPAAYLDDAAPVAERLMDRAFGALGTGG